MGLGVGIYVYKNSYINNHFLSCNTNLYVLFNLNDLIQIYGIFRYVQI